MQRVFPQYKTLGGRLNFWWMVVACLLSAAAPTVAQKPKSGATITKNVAKESRPSETNPWHIIDVGGRDYVTLESIRNFYNSLFGFREVRQDGNHVWLMSNKLVIKAQVGSQELLMNNMKLFLSFPVISHGSNTLISRLDLVMLVDPILNPSHIQRAEYFDTVVVDAGHGGHDAGARGVYGYEKDYTLQMAQHLRTALMARGFNVVLTRSKDETLSAEERVKIANNSTQSIFIHLGFYSRNKKESGIETQALSPNSGGSPHDGSNIALASAVQAKVLSTVKVGDRGVSRSQDPLLLKLKSPGIIFLGGNLKNEKEGLLIASENYQKTVAAAISDAVTNYREALEPAMTDKPLSDMKKPDEKHQAELPRTALVMGVGDYAGAKFKEGLIQDLPGITSVDLPSMEAKLKTLGFSVTVVANPSLSEAKEAVDAFSAKIKASPGISLFYFSGHGGEHDGKNYLIPRGANIRGKADLSDEALNAQRVLNGMEESGAQVNLVFLDCCRQDLGKGADGAEMAPLKARGSFIGFATRSGDFADPGEQGSPYTRFLLKHLDKPGLSLLDMYAMVIGDVKDYSKRVLGEERRPGFYSELDVPVYLVPVDQGSDPKHVTSLSADTMAEINRRAREMAALLVKDAKIPPSEKLDKPVNDEAGKAFINSLGMRFVPVPGTNILMCVHETRNMDYAGFAQAKKGSAEPEDKERIIGAKHPVVSVTYEDAERFCRWLSEKEGKTYRLPTDEEWSAAAGNSEYPWGNLFPPEASDGNYDVKSIEDGYERTAPVMSFRPNRLGIFDLGGNAWEWCSTWYTADLNDEETKKEIPASKDDQGGMTYRVLRGASWVSDARVSLRSSYRVGVHPSNRYDGNGFRCVLVVAGG